MGMVHYLSMLAVMVLIFWKSNQSFLNIYGGHAIVASLQQKFLNEHNEPHRIRLAINVEQSPAEVQTHKSPSN